MIKTKDTFAILEGKIDIPTFFSHQLLKLVNFSILISIPDVSEKIGVIMLLTCSTCTLIFDF